MEYAKQSGYLPTGPDNADGNSELNSTENSDIANNSRAYYADLLNGTQGG